MSRFDRRTGLACLLFLWPVLVAAADGQTAAPSPPAAATVAPTPRKKPAVKFTTLALGYVSWGEVVNVQNTSGQANHVHANLLGNALMIERERYEHSRYGYSLRGSFLFGLADVGGTSTNPSYQQGGARWYGGEVSPRFAVRASSWVTVSAGPMLLYRSLVWPTIGATTASGGSSLNVGTTLDIRFRILKQIELREEIGGLSILADTYWALGVGYKF